MSPRYFIIHKPYKMISQFVSPHKKRLLGDLDFEFPEGIHAIGRLDDNSEGLLILTTDKSLTRRLLHPDLKHSRTYIVQVEKIVSDEKLQMMSSGVDIIAKRVGHYHTMPCEVKRIEKPGWITERQHQFREDLPQTWLEITLREGKYHQVRKMCSAIGHDCKRLIRTSIDNLELGDLKPGEVREMTQQDMFSRLNLMNT
ncbi:MAG: rRNA pseudouridine synthase [Bacteroidetes bacterium]|nr:rRNA pseudouridine synthase [Bacteroidota bacterium]